MNEQGTTWLRLAALIVAVTAAALVIWQKHLLAHPVSWPGLVLVLAAALPFAVDARFPRLLRASWRGGFAVLLVLGCAAALLTYRPTGGDAAVLFFIALAAECSAAAPLWLSVGVGAAAVALPEAMNLAGVAHVSLAGAIGTAFAWAAGTAMRAQDRLTRELVAMQAQAAEHEITAERQQLAREFHDLVGHTLSVTMLHMTAARMSLDDGEISEALESLSEAEVTGREAMREMRQSVALLGTPSSGSAAALPQARDLADLVAGYGSAGLKVKLDMTGDPATIPGDVGLAAYRIVQESLANAAKHAPDATVQLTVLVAGAELRVTVSNDIRGSSEVGSGHGISGMTQRAALLGGTLSAGPAGRRWRVEAVLPLGDR